jgi:hypothetical protein
MNTTERDLESRLRTALAEDAERSPAQEGAPVPPFAGADRQPTGPQQPTVRHPHRLRWSLGIAAAAAVAVGATVIGIPGDSRQAVAGWTSRPQTGAQTKAAVDDAVRLCLRDERANENRKLHVEGTDMRGDGVFVALSGPKVSIGCLVDTVHDDTLAIEERKSDSPLIRPSSADPLVLLNVDTPSGNALDKPQQAYVSGRVDASVSTVRVATSHGLVEATVRNGVFAAWWPGNDIETAEVTAYDANGRELAKADQLTCAEMTDGRLNIRTARPGQPTTPGCPLPE